MGINGPGRVKAAAYRSSSSERLRCAACQAEREAVQPSEPARGASRRGIAQGLKKNAVNAVVAVFDFHNFELQKRVSIGYTLAP